MLSRLLPATLVLTFIALSTFWRMWSQYQRYGTSGVFLFTSGVLKYHVRDGLLVAFFVAVSLQAALVAFMPGHEAALGPLRFLESSTMHALGIILTIGGTVCLVVGQNQLGAAWRVGIDETTHAALRTDGMYEFCRNPIYLSWWIWTLGYLLLIPTWVSVVVLVGLTLVIHWNVEEEERFLLRAHGEAYRAYGRRVGRFIPWLRRFE